jgi:hypothetical protein
MGPRGGMGSGGPMMGGGIPFSVMAAFFLLVVLVFAVGLVAIALWSRVAPQDRPQLTHGKVVDPRLRAVRSAPGPAATGS